MSALPRSSPARRFSLFVAPSVLQGALSFALLPLSTLRLDASDFAVFGLVTGFTSLGAVVSSLGAAYILAHRFPAAAPEARGRLVTTLVLLGFVAAALFCAVFLLGWTALAPRWAVAAEIPWAAPLLAAAAVLVGAPWIVALEVLTLSGGATLFAVVSVAQSLLAAAALLIALFVWDLDFVALFVSTFVAALVGGIGALAVLRPWLGGGFDRAALQESLRLGGPLVASNGLDALVVMAERTLLSSFVGLHLFGLYFHSQQYLTVAMTAVKALFRTVWPLSLAEARAGDAAFAATRRFWDAAFLLVTAAGMGAALFGEAIIDWLTHGKFGAAAPFVALWMAFLLVQLSGRPQQAVLYAHGRGDAVVNSRVVATLVSALALALVPVLGVVAAVFSRFLQSAIVRFAYELTSRRVRATPWQDTLPVLGIAAILATTVLVFAAEPGFGARVAVFAAALALMTWAAAPSLRVLLARPVQDVPRSAL